MRYITICILALLTGSGIHAQDKVEEVAKFVCDCITEHKETMDSALIMYCYGKAFKNIEGLPTNENKLNKLFEKVHYTLGKNCAIYHDAMDKISPQKGDWKTADSTTASKLKTAECRQIEGKNLYYLEGNGDTTYVTIKDGIYQDNFKDGKYSQCKFRWLNDCEFELEYIKATEESRKKLSKKGDKYVYRIIDRVDNYYLTLAHVGNVWMEFKIYVQE